MSTIFAHFQPFPPISSPAWALAHGVRAGHQFKSGGKPRVGKKKDEDPSKHGGGSVEVHPSIQYRDVVKSKLKAMHAKEVAIYKDRWPSTPPPPMSVRKCRPLERVLFLNEFRRAHLDFWKNNHKAEWLVHNDS